MAREPSCRPRRRSQANSWPTSRRSAGEHINLTGDTAGRAPTVGHRETLNVGSRPLPQTTRSALRSPASRVSFHSVMICHRVVVCPAGVRTAGTHRTRGGCRVPLTRQTGPAPSRRGLRRRLRSRLPGVGRLATRRRVRAGRGRRGVRGAPADRRGPSPPRRLRRRHPTHRGAADLHRPRRRREHGLGGKLGGGAVLVDRTNRPASTK